MFEGLQNINFLPATGSEIIGNITVSLVCGYLLSWLYRHTYRGPGYSIPFINSIVLLSMITAIVTMVIGNNLARAFGLVGAMSIIRFRTAVKNTEDIVYLFFALAIGMASGVGYYKLAFTGTFFVGLIIYVLAKSKIFVPRQNEYLLQFNFTAGKEEVPSYQPIFNKHCNKYTPINVKSVDEDGLLELSFYVRLKDIDKSQDFIRDLHKASGVQYVNLFFDEEPF
jgi:uncharacterized membrane protein YhiD involved in acid resistance